MSNSASAATIGRTISITTRHKWAMELREAILAETSLQGFNREFVQRHLTESRFEMRTLVVSDTIGN